MLQPLPALHRKTELNLQSSSGSQEQSRKKWKKRLVSRLKRYDPLHIYREGKASGLNLAGYKKYLNQVWLMYNGSSRKNALPQKY